MRAVISSVVLSAISIALVLVFPTAAQDQEKKPDPRSETLRALGEVRLKIEEAAQEAAEAARKAKSVRLRAVQSLEDEPLLPDLLIAMLTQAYGIKKLADSQLAAAADLEKKVTLVTEQIIVTPGVAIADDTRSKAETFAEAAKALTRETTDVSARAAVLSRTFDAFVDDEEAPVLPAIGADVERRKMREKERDAKEKLRKLRREHAETGCIIEATCTPVSIYFGTDRAEQEGLQRVYFSAARTDRLALGKAIVTVPRANREIGEVNRPSWRDLLSLRNPWREDPTLHFTIPEDGITLFASPDEFIAAAKEHIANGGEFKDHVFVFVHGYNVSFDDALYRTAQIAYDLGDEDTPFGTAFMYSWPSAGEFTDYAYDFDSARLTVGHLREFLQLVTDKTGAKHVHLIAHSMGNWPLVTVLNEIAAKHAGRPTISQVILAAPDIDVAEFKKIAEKIHTIADGVTLYASSNDRAMMASRAVHGDVQRAGDVSAKGPVVVSGIDSIDVSDVNTEFLALNHSTYADTKELLHDVWSLVRTGERPPDKRNEHLQIKGAPESVYWRYAEPDPGSSNRLRPAP